MTEPGPFQLFYDGPLQHPGLLWLAAAAGLARCLSLAKVAPHVKWYGIALAALSASDAWLTSNDVLGFGAPLGGPAASFVPLFFVVAGDLRFLLIVTSASPRGTLKISRRALGQAIALCIIVPISSQIIVTLLPAGFGGSRTLFLVYEVSFVLLTWVLLRAHPNVRSAPWVRSLSRFVILYYALWAGADVLILWLGDVGFLVRVVPNVLYYGGFIGALGWFAAQSRGVAGEGVATVAERIDA